MVAGKTKGHAAIESLWGAAARRLLRGQAAIDSAAPSAGSLRGQAAIEAMSYGAFFLLVFVGGAFVFLQMQGHDLSRAENAYAQQLAYSFADKVHVAEVAGPGFVQYVPVPSDLLGRDYNLTISRPVARGASERESGFVYVDWIASNGRLSSASAPAITTKYGVTTGQGVSINGEGFIVVRPGAGRIRMENVNGTIWISKG